MKGLSLSGPSFPAGQPLPCLLSQSSLANTDLLQSVASSWCLAFVVGAFGSWRMPLPGPAEKEATLSLFAEIAECCLL